ncbi:MAG TPA: DUF3592 domain-containing protein [Pirellulales bacterium]|nr:DUF3592 domain-containing protein [Pirellulales bacterium]
MTSYRTIAAFLTPADADSLCGELLARGLRATVLAATESSRSVFEVQVDKIDYREASSFFAEARRPKWSPDDKQFSLRTVLALVTGVCVVLALTRRFGFLSAFQGLLFASVGVFFLAGGVLLFQRTRASRRWPSVCGRIDDSHLEFDDEGYHVHITYRFCVSGHEYHSEAVSYSGVNVAYEPMRQRIVRYPKGLEVNVFYDPRHPRIAVLERGGHLFIALFVVVFGLGFSIFGIACFFGMLG